MSLAAIVIITIINSALFYILGVLYRRDQYQARYGNKLIALMGAVFIIEMAMLAAKLQEAL